MSSAPVPVALASGDGIGPEITRAVVRILDAAEAPVVFVPVSLGQTVFEAGHLSGVTPDALDTIENVGLLLKAPLATPSGGGYRSVNVTLRQHFDLYANVRPVRSHHPAIATHHPALDVVIVRENVEDLYAGLEYQLSAETAIGVKYLTCHGCERIIRHAFTYATENGRSNVTAMSKPNIMKLTDGMFARTFAEVAADFPHIDADHLIVDIGMGRFAADPTTFDVVVTQNLYGDILSDIASELAGSVGMSGTANLGASTAMFEAVHGTAPDIAGEGLANPSGLLHAAISLLEHVGATNTAGRISSAWQATVHAGIHTGDVFRDGTSMARVGTDAFTDAVIEHLDGPPTVSDRAVRPRPATGLASKGQVLPASGGSVDIYLRWDGPFDTLLASVSPLSGFEHAGLTQGGVPVETTSTDHDVLTATFVSSPSPGPVGGLIDALDRAGADVRGYLRSGDRPE